MKIYKANEELIEILKKNGFIETSSEIDILKGKKEFKLSKSSRKRIYFDRIKIEIFDGIHGSENTFGINENEFRILMLYFKLSSTDLKEILRNRKFSYSFGIQNFNYLKKELQDLKRLNFKKHRIPKLERIIEMYNQPKI